MKKILANIDFLLPGLVLMIFVARIFPFQPAYLTYFPMPEITFWGVVIIFLLYGMKLSPKAMLSDLANWKLHLATQAATYLIIPILVLLLLPFFYGSADYDLWLALFFLSVLPSTVSMSVIFVVKNKGNLGGAIFNSGISGFLGMILTPLWLSFFVNDKGVSDGTNDLILKLVQQIFIPIVFGMSFRYFAPKSSERLINYFKNFDKYIVLLIVYSSFSNAFNRDLFSMIPLNQLLVLIVGVVALYLIVVKLLGFLGRILDFPREDILVLLFSGSQKSLVHGSVFALLIFQDVEMQTFALLPLMIYHAFQLLFASYKSIVWEAQGLNG
jgi:solute carrier family 10 (sodium/bile acid cotransporter), member 7